MQGKDKRFMTMGGPAEAVFRNGWVPEGFAFGILMLAFMSMFACVMHGISLFVQQRERRYTGDDICYKV